MDLNLAMRYVMVQSQKEASGNSVKAEHLFLGLLTLSKKNALDLASDAQMQSRITSDMQGVKNLFESRRIPIDETGEKLRFLLNADPSQAETEASNLLLQAMDTCKQQGITEVTASVVLEQILKSPTTLIGKVLASPADVKQQGNQTIYDPKEEPKKAETVIQKPEPKPAPKPEPKPAPKQEPKPSPPPKPAPNEPIIFELPKPEDVKNQQQNPQKPQKPYHAPKEKKYTRISGIKIRGGVFWAFTKYLFWVTLIPFAILALMEYQWHLVTVPSSNKFLFGLPYSITFMWFFLVIYGVISLIGRRLQAFAEFLYFLTNLGLWYVVINLNLYVNHKEVFTKWELVSAWFMVLFFLFYSLYRLNYYKNASTGNSQSLNSSMLRISGTPAFIFFIYLLRMLIIPILVWSIISIFNLSVNSFWKAFFYIYGFFCAWDIIRMAIQCNALRRYKDVVNDFWFLQHIFLFLPELGLFLMWYFGWFPMRSWVIWVYCIYGLFWLSITGSLLMNKGK